MRLRFPPQAPVIKLERSRLANGTTRFLSGVAKLPAVFFLLVAACNIAASAWQLDGYDRGHIGTIRLQIPKVAELSGVKYEDSDSASSSAGVSDDFRRPISTFDLLLALPSLSYQDGSKVVIDEHHRLGVTALHADYVGNPNGPQDGLNIILKDPGPFGPYEKIENIYGLSHWHSLEPSVILLAHLFGSADRSTYISCAGDPLFTGLAGFGRCVQFFTIPEYQITVEMTYDRKWLKSWRSIQRNVTRLIRSFEIKRR